MVTNPNNLSDKELLKRAESIRIASDDPHVALGISDGVGCVIYKNGHIISESANALPTTISNKDVDIEPYSPLRYDLIEHAERRAIFLALKKGEALYAATLYCTRPPCSDCARAIAEVGIDRVFLSNKVSTEKTNYNPGEKDWRSSQEAALRIFKLSGVKVYYIDNNGISSDDNNEES